MPQPSLTSRHLGSTHTMIASSRSASFTCSAKFDVYVTLVNPKWELPPEVTSITGIKAEE